MRSRKGTLHSSLSSHLVASNNALEPSPEIEESLKHASFMSDLNSGDHTTVKMKTRVAVRDKNPHRFQVVPLRDITKLQAALAQVENNPNHLSAPSSGNFLVCSPSSQLSSYSRSRLPSMTPSASGQSLQSTNAKENCFPERLPKETVMQLESRKLAMSVPNSRSPSQSLGQRSAVALPLVDIIPKAYTLESNNGPKDPPSPLEEDDSVLTVYSENFGTVLTPSQSFQFEPQQRTQARFARLSDLLGPDNPLQFTTPKKGRHSRRHKSRPKVVPAKLAMEDLEPPTTPVGRKPDPRSRRAEFPPTSLFLPFLKKEDSFRGNSSPDELLSSTLCEPTPSPETTKHALVASVGLKSTDKTLFQSDVIFECDSDDEQIVTGTVLDDPFVMDSNVPIVAFAYGTPVKHSSPQTPIKPSAAPAAKLESNKPEWKTPERRELAIVYPKIILDLFAEVDILLEEWRPVHRPA
ncbi:hypothetical protein D9613_005477 [Agrocybe pediades]|uniref:Uncharacterized protein n=1 Tax=Agrocybe pediades TaxID=84607 RepID=A0A8H4VU32_9AGAR|nr:hypothetical protein D9613_005477 [Agrocybe pediades]